MFCKQCENAYSLAKSVEGMPPEEIGFYLCSHCGFSEKIPDNSLLYKKQLGKKKYNHTVAKYAMLDIHPRLPNYVCPNKSCNTHKPSYNKSRECVIVKDRDYRIRYVCQECHYEKYV